MNPAMVVEQACRCAPCEGPPWWLVVPLAVAIWLLVMSWAVVTASTALGAWREWRKP